MRLERIALRGFLSHEATDWSPNGARLVTLVGPNGAGKSSLAVDGLMFALWDDARGRTDDLVRLGSTDMAVTVEFTFGEDRYRVTRGRTTKAGGKSFLELAVQDGEAWRPLTGPTIRDTQAMIGDLLHLDAEAFGTAVVLAQGDSMRFAEATPGERKKILGTVLGLDVWERAEARARELARDIDGRCTLANGEIERIEGRAAALAEAPGLVEHWQSELAGIGEAEKLATAHRTEAEASLRDLAGRVEAVKAAVTEVDRLTAQLEDQKGRWRRATEGRTEAEGEVARATTRLAAFEGRPTPRAGRSLADIEAAQLTRAAELDDWERREREAQAAYDAELSAWRQEKASRESRVATLQAALDAIQPVTCPDCGKRFRADPGDVLGALTEARAVLARIGGEPKVSLELAKAENQARLVREKIADLDHEAAMAQLDAARNRLGRARDELAAIEQAGKAAREALTSATEQAAEGADLLERIQREQAVVRAADEALAALSAKRSEAQGELATAQAQAAERDRLVAEAERLATAAEADAIELVRMRRLVQAFGVQGIPARIIASVLPEVEGYANELLSQLRPGMSLALRAQRARRAGDGVIEALDLLVSDDAGERSLAMFSGGERMSVSLAIAVALSRLVARRAGTAIRTLVIDEPDGLDADARRSFGQALRVLAHQALLDRVVLVSHHPDLADAGDETYRVTKVDGRSVVEVAA